MFCRLFLKQNFHIYCFSPTEEAKLCFDTAIIKI